MNKTKYNNNKRINKKAIGTVVSTALLLFLGISAYVVLQTWYFEYSSDLQYKYTQKTIIEKDKVKIMKIQNDSSILTLYIESRANYDIKIEKITINEQPCILNGGNGIFPGLTKISLNCQNITNKINEIQIITKTSILNKKIYGIH